MQSEGRPQLPAAFELICVGEVENLRDSVSDLARDGAVEGTVIMAENQTKTLGCANKAWHGYAENLHAAILLQPEFDPERDQEMFYVAMTSLGNAIAEHVSPMTALAYSWPNDINIAGNKVGSVWLDHGQSATGRWLTVTCSVNVRHSPDDFNIPAMSILEAEGTTDLTANILLESWSRQFVRLINLWSDQGFEKIFGLWQVRSESIGKKIELPKDDGLVAGEIVAVTEHGDIILELRDKRQILVSARTVMNSKSES